MKARPALPERVRSMEGLGVAERRHRSREQRQRATATKICLPQARERCWNSSYPDTPIVRMKIGDDEDRWSFRTPPIPHIPIGTALLEIEPRLRRVRGMRHLPALRAALQREMGIVKRQAAA